MLEVRSFFGPHASSFPNRPPTSCAGACGLRPGAVVADEDAGVRGHRSAACTATAEHGGRGVPEGAVQRRRASLGDSSAVRPRDALALGIVRGRHATHLSAGLDYASALA